MKEFSSEINDFENVEFPKSELFSRGSYEMYKADGVFKMVMKEHMGEENLQEEDEPERGSATPEYYEKIADMPIRSEDWEKMQEGDWTFKEYCDRNGIEDPTDCYEPRIEPYHQKKMEEMGVDVDEYCNEEGLNVYDILVDSEVLKDLYDAE